MGRKPKQPPQDHLHNLIVSAGDTAKGTIKGTKLNDLMDFIFMAGLGYLGYKSMRVDIDTRIHCIEERINSLRQDIVQASQRMRVENEEYYRYDAQLATFFKEKADYQVWYRRMIIEAQTQPERIPDDFQERYDEAQARYQDVIRIAQEQMARLRPAIEIYQRAIEAGNREIASLQTQLEDLRERRPSMEDSFLFGSVPAMAGYKLAKTGDLLATPTGLALLGAIGLRFGLASRECPYYPPGLVIPGQEPTPPPTEAVPLPFEAQLAQWMLTVRPPTTQIPIVGDIFQWIFGGIG